MKRLLFFLGLALGLSVSGPAQGAQVLVNNGTITNSATNALNGRIAVGHSGQVALGVKFKLTATNTAANVTFRLSASMDGTTASLGTAGLLATNVVTVAHDNMTNLCFVTNFTTYGAIPYVFLTAIENGTTNAVTNLYVWANSPD